jgi:hypothetical protein
MPFQRRKWESRRRAKGLKGLNCNEVEKNKALFASEAISLE